MLLLSLPKKMYHVSVVNHTKVLSGTNKERNQWVFWGSKVLLDKGTPTVLRSVEIPVSELKWAN